MKERIPLAEGVKLANEVVALLETSCERLEVAGSIRRQKETVGDVEIVCIPRFSTGCSRPPPIAAKSWRK